MSSAQHDKMHPHREQARIPHDYTDLSPSDIALLTSILGHAPRRRASTSGYEQVVRGLISSLPSHLRSKLPWLSSSCSLHHRINSLPVGSILKWVQSEIESCLPDVWTPARKRGVLTPGQADMLTALEDLSGLWLSPEAFQLKYNRAQTTNPPYEHSSKKCSACMLAQIGGNVNVLTALGGYFIGRVDTTIWKRSKRIMWMEAWLRDAVESSQEESAIQDMWKLGIQLRELRRKAAAPNRGYIDEYIEQVRMAESIERPQHSQNVDPEKAADSQCQTSRVPEWEEATTDDIFGDHNEASITPEEPQRHQSHAGSNGPASVLRSHEAGYSPRPASSFYSRAWDDDEWDESSPHDSVSELLDCYRHSTLTTRYIQQAEGPGGNVRSSTSGTSHRTRDPELAKYPRHKVPIVTIPRDSNG